MEQDNLDNRELDVRNPDNGNQAVALRSVPNTNKVKIRFVNLTDREVNVIWIDFSGMCVSSLILIKKHDYCDINTYRHHPWIATDNKTQDRLLIDKQFTYYPIPYEPPQRLLHMINPSQPIRRTVYITLPLYSLRYNVMLNLRNYVKTVEHVDRLDLPREVASDLKKVIKQKYHSTPWGFRE